MKRIFLIALVLPALVFTSCKKDLTSLNVDPKSPASVSPESLFTNAQHNLADVLASPSVNVNNFRLFVQYWQETTYTDESNYDLSVRNQPQGVWNTFYRDVLEDFQTSKDLILASGASGAMQTNQVTQADIMQVLAYYYLVITYGDIPYTQALDIEGTTSPVFDKQADVYSALLTRLDADIAALDPSADGFGGADIIYNGDIASWKLFAQTLKLKMGILLADVNSATAKSTVESAVAAGVFTSNADNANFSYLSAPPNTNPVWTSLVQSGRKDYVGAVTLVDKLKALNDPRLPLFFTTDFAGGYSGGGIGDNNNYTTFSKPADALTAPDFPYVFLGYDEVEFILAEAVERGYNVGGTAMEHYNNGVTASIQMWGGTTSQATAYLAQPSVAYSTAAGDYKQKIGTQKWLALYNRGWDAWTEVRRLDYPVLPDPINALSGFPVRLTYPTGEQNLNTANYNTAASSIGGDVVETKLFWDKF